MNSFTLSSVWSEKYKYFSVAQSFATGESGFMDQILFDFLWWYYEVSDMQ